MEIEDTAALEHTHTLSANNSRFRVHQAELRQMAVFCISIFTMSLLPYTSPALADYRPWKSDEAHSPNRTLDTTTQNDRGCQWCDCGRG